MEKNKNQYPPQENGLQKHLLEPFKLGFEPKNLVTGINEEALMRQEIERLKILGESFEGMFVVLDKEGFPMWPTVSLDKETAIERMVKLGPDKPWEYYIDKGYKVEKVTINIKKEKP